MFITHAYFFILNNTRRPTTIVVLYYIKFHRHYIIVHASYSCTDDDSHNHYLSTYIFISFRYSIPFYDIPKFINTLLYHLQIHVPK